jgi:23S rRNA (cytidine2498-2'-O)-methyltransferase
MQPNQTVYIAHPDFLKELCDEFGGDVIVHGNMVFSPRKKTDICFALDVWLDAEIVTFESISQAVKILRAAGRFWYLNPFDSVRRSRLIESELRKCPEIPTVFPVSVEQPEIGVFSLLDKNTLVFATRRWKKAPLGFYDFVEDKMNPPNRAYLKLWEALSLCDGLPGAGELVVDLGASPGGWSWVMQGLGADVVAVDKALLDPAIAALPRLTYLQQSAFALEPESFRDWVPRSSRGMTDVRVSRSSGMTGVGTHDVAVDWLLCDVACYPERTYDLIQKWMATGKVKHFIFTIKLQGETDLSVLKKFQDIHNSRVLHLFQNKHEVTFIYPAVTLNSRLA